MLRVQHVIIESEARDTALFANANNFIARLDTPLRDVVAIRVLYAELQPHSSTNNNNYNQNPAYLYLNGYANLHLANGTATNVFMRLPLGTEQYHSTTENILNDAHAYLCRPQEPKLDRFEVRIVNKTGAIHSTYHDAQLIVTLAVYTADRVNSPLA